MRFPRIRRGSTLVMVAFMLIPLMAVMAIAVDISRFYVVTGELQTAADASALAGAATLQMTASASPKPAVDAAVAAFALSSNRVDGNSVTIPSSDVKLGYWTPGTGTVAGTFDLALNGRRANAVSVDVNGSPRGTFSQVIGKAAGLPLRRTGIAWIGQVSLNCVRPFNFPYGPFYKRVNNLSAIPADPIPDIDPVAFAAFQNTSVANRTVIVLGKGESSGSLPNDGNWDGYNLPTAKGNTPANEATFQSQIETCGNVAVNGDAAAGKIVPSNGNGNKCSAQNKTTCALIDAIATPVNGAFNNCATFRAGDAGCYASNAAQSPGVTIEMAWGDASNGVHVDFRYVAEFTLMCVFTAPNEKCAALPNPNALYNYPSGTVVGVAQGLKSRILNPTDIVSNSPSNVQRLLLVK